jgi:hypothetical protein
MPASTHVGIFGEFKLKFDVVTSFHKTAYDLYGKTFVENFINRFPEDVNLYVVINDFMFESTDPRVIVLDIDAEHPRYAAIRQNWKERPECTGLVPSSQDTEQIPAWLALTGASNISMSAANALKYSYKVIAQYIVYQKTKADRLLWLDADVFIFDNVTYSLLEKMAPSDTEVVSYLGREYVEPDWHTGRGSTETGWLCWNTQLANDFITEYAELYVTGKVLALENRADGNVFDYLKPIYKSKGSHLKNLGNPEWGHDPFNNSDLGTCMDHRKGGLKLQKTVVTGRREPYWSDLVYRKFKITGSVYDTDTKVDVKIRRHWKYKGPVIDGQLHNNRVLLEGEFPQWAPAEQSMALVEFKVLQGMVVLLNFHFNWWHCYISFAQHSDSFEVPYEGALRKQDKDLWTDLDKNWHALSCITKVSKDGTVTPVGDYELHDCELHTGDTLKFQLNIPKIGKRGSEYNSWLEED